MPKIAIIANTKSRAGAGWAAYEALIVDRKHMQVYKLGDTSLDEMILTAWESGCQTIVAAGGDGTVSSVADAIVRLEIPARLGILPAGTLNHFAKDLGIPLDISEALHVIENGRTIQIDIAKVNDRYFINNSSIGLYPSIVNARHALERDGTNTWFALFKVLIATSMRRFSYEIHLGKGEGSVLKKTSSIFVGNNKYIFYGFTIGARAKLDEGVLYVALLNSVHTLKVLSLLYKALRGAVLSDRDFNVTGLQECTINSKKRNILVSYDGEVASMTPPLHYSIAPKALNVIAPAV